MNLAMGQGDLQTDPLQMAVAYAAIGNGGDVVRPHVGCKDVEDPNGSVVQEIDPGPQRHLDINPQYRSAILQGIHLAAQSPGGTSYPVFGNFPIPMAGKTGTAQRTSRDRGRPVLVHVRWRHIRTREIVVAATIEQGGFGVQAAAPVARQILTAYYDEHPAEAKEAGGKPPAFSPGRVLVVVGGEEDLRHRTPLLDRRRDDDLAGFGYGAMHTYQDWSW